MTAISAIAQPPCAADVAVEVSNIAFTDTLAVFREEVQVFRSNIQHDVIVKYEAVIARLDHHVRCIAAQVDLVLRLTAQHFTGQYLAFQAKHRIRALAGNVDLLRTETDFLINLPVLKAHCQTNLTCSLKNLKGCIPDSEKRRFHSLGLMKPIACLSSILRPNLTIVDAICGDLTFEEGGHPVPMDRLIGGTDPVLIDSYGAELLGFPVDEIAYLPLAEKLGAGSTDISNCVIHEHHAEEKKQTLFKASGIARELANHVTADAACSVCYGSLIHALQRLRENGKRIPKGICIGQGFRGKSGEGVGVGNCTAGFPVHLKGCPPTAKAMADFLAQEKKTP